MRFPGNFKGIWIPASISLNEELSNEEKILLAEIQGLEGDDGCYASNSYFAKILGKKRRQIQNYLKKLKQKELIIVLNSTSKKRKLFTKNKLLETMQSVAPNYAIHCIDTMQSIAPIYNRDNIINKEKTKIIPEKVFRRNFFRNNQGDEISISKVRRNFSRNNQDGEISISKGRKIHSELDLYPPIDEILRRR